MREDVEKGDRGLASRGGFRASKVDVWNRGRGMIQEPRYLANLRGARGTSMDEGLGAEKKGMQCGKSGDGRHRHREKERQEKRHGYTGQELTFGAIE